MWQPSPNGSMWRRYWKGACGASRTRCGSPWAHGRAAGRQVWSEQYGGTFPVFAVQEIATAIAARLSQLGAMRPRAERRSHSIGVRALSPGQAARAAAGRRQPTPSRISAKPSNSTRTTRRRTPGWPRRTVLALRHRGADRGPGPGTDSGRARGRARSVQRAHRALGLVELYLGWHLDRAEASLRRAVELARIRRPRLARHDLAFTVGRMRRVERGSQWSWGLAPHVILAGNAVGAAETGYRARADRSRTGLEPDLVAGRTSGDDAAHAQAFAGSGRGLRHRAGGLCDAPCVARTLPALGGAGRRSTEIAASLTERVERTQRGLRRSRGCSGTWASTIGPSPPCSGRSTITRSWRGAIRSGCRNGWIREGPALGEAAGVGWAFSPGRRT